jgi:hypothetical protein
MWSCFSENFRIIFAINDVSEISPVIHFATKEETKIMFTTSTNKTVMAIAIILSTTTAAVAETLTPLPRAPRIPYLAPSFTCGPHLVTFAVKPQDQREGTGVRCVKMSEGTPGGNPLLPKLAWYGEGNWNGANYRHVGHAFYQDGTLVGAAADFQEDIHNNFPFGTLKLELVDANTIQVTGAWNETWSRVDKVNYKTLPRPKACGKFFDQYNVSDLSPSGRVGEGLRCALQAEHNPPELQTARLPLVKGVTTWFGNGYWGTPKNTYSHLGTFAHNGYGASDICGRPFGPTCNNFGWGSLRFNPFTDGFKVTGAWRERWRR